MFNYVGTSYQVGFETYSFLIRLTNTEQPKHFSILLNFPSEIEFLLDKLAYSAKKREF